jgi:hypothetical protein
MGESIRAQTEVDKQIMKDHKTLRLLLKKTNIIKENNMNCVYMSESEPLYG